MDTKTVFITGSSSGIGKASAQYFYDQGWNVIASMRTPEKEKDLKPDARMRLIALDVQDLNSIGSAVAEALAVFPKIDVWVNNAGYGAVGPLEAGSREQIQKQFDVNFFGLIDCIKAVLPHFKQNQSGTIINVSSIVGLISLPLYSMYNATKFAVEGLSESVSYELREFGIRVKLVEPGSIQTEFLGRSSEEWGVEKKPEYKPFVNQVMKTIRNPDMLQKSGSPEMVAKVIYKAATSESSRLRYFAGRDAKMAWIARRILGYRIQMWGLRKFVGLK